MEATTLALILLGAVVALDQVSFAQIQLAHPLAAGAFAGGIAGGLPGAGEGALAGALLGLILAGHRPVGGVIPPDGGPAAVVASAGLVQGSHAGLGDSAGGTGGALAFALLIGLALATLGRGTERWTRRRNLGFLRAAEREATPAAVRKAVAQALALAGLRGALTVLIALPLARAFIALAPEAPPRAAVIALAGGVGLAAQERLLGARRARGFLLAGIGAALTTWAAIRSGWIP